MSPSDPGAERPYDIVLFGATGFTGELVAEYLALHGRPELRWALAGRNRGKLEAVRKRLQARARKTSGDDGDLAKLPLLEADSNDAYSLAELAKQARVICTTVGPYARYGAPLVGACVDAGTDYCDLTGEVQFIRQMIDSNHERAREVGARIVHCAGFDSIPSDLGTLMVQEAAFERHGRPCSSILFLLGKNRGAISGGTAASMLQILKEAASDKAVRRILGDPYSLNPKGERSGPDGQSQAGVSYNRDLETYVAPFLMAGINERVVRRSNALLGYRYGKSFRYREVTRLPRGTRGYLAGHGLTLGMVGVTAAGLFSPTRKLLGRLLPDPGEGPSREARERGMFEIELVGKVADKQGRSTTIVGKVVGTQDPGYGETAKMLGETAQCLALDRKRCPGEGGILTPASALGMVLVERLRAAGMTFSLS